jgi:hypothetical protein
MGRELIELPLKNTKAPGTRGTRGLDGLGFRDHRLCFCLTIRIVDQFRCSRAVAISGYFLGRRQARLQFITGRRRMATHREVQWADDTNAAINLVLVIPG